MPRFFKVQCSKCKVQMWCRMRDKSYDLGPGVKPQDPGHESPVRQHRQSFVIAREPCDRGEPVDNKVARMRAGIIIYWIASFHSQ